MTFDGYIQGTTKSPAAGGRPGEKALWTYTGALFHGQQLFTYLDRIEAYFVDDLTTLDGTNRTYHTNIYQVVQPYGRVYVSVYMGYESGTSGGAGVANTSSAKVNALIVGER